MKTVHLAGPTDVAGFRREARALLGAGVQPDEVEWLSGEAPASLWAGLPEAPSHEARLEPPHTGAAGVRSEGPALHERSAAAGPVSSPAAVVLPVRADDDEPPPFTVPASYLRLCAHALLHREPQRFALMYRLLLRLRAQPDFWRDPLQPERRRAEQLAREVQHDIHQMRAFVRFTPVDTPQGTRHIAWFEPDHHTVAANADFFVRRFARMRWAILTPDASIEWDGSTLHHGPGGSRRDAPPPDAGASLWLTYYQNIFNPARLKVDMMVKEMPQRYWANLPEAVLIQPLVAGAAARAGAMVEAEPTAPRAIKPMRRPG